MDTALRAILNIADRIVLVVAILLGLTVLLLIGNTIRLDIENRKDYDGAIFFYQYFAHFHHE